MSVSTWPPIERCDPPHDESSGGSRPHTQCCFKPPATGMDRPAQHLAKSLLCLSLQTPYLRHGELLGLQSPGLALPTRWSALCCPLTHPDSLNALARQLRNSRAGNRAGRRACPHDVWSSIMGTLRQRANQTSHDVVIIHHTLKKARMRKRY